MYRPFLLGIALKYLRKKTGLLKALKLSQVKKFSPSASPLLILHPPYAPETQVTSCRIDHLRNARGRAIPIAIVDGAQMRTAF